jgi:predicted RNA-binding Zn ribbon-like protein
MGHGAGWVTSAESHHAQESHTWPRLKICRNELCGCAFYDRSRNNSGVWHDVRECGSAINLRASRARRKQQAQPRADNTPEAG